MYDNALVKVLSAAYGQELSPDNFNLTLGNLPPGGSLHYAQLTSWKLKLTAH